MIQCFSALPSGRCSSRNSERRPKPLNQEDCDWKGDMWCKAGVTEQPTVARRWCEEARALWRVAGGSRQPAAAEHADPPLPHDADSFLDSSRGGRGYVLRKTYPVTPQRYDPSGKVPVLQYPKAGCHGRCHGTRGCKRNVNSKAVQVLECSL